MKKLFSTFLVAFLLNVGTVEAASSQRSSGKNARGQTASKSTKSTSKRSASKRRSTSRRAASSRPARPTRERYMEIQQALADKGFYDGPIDGVWSATCVDALKKFQENEGLAVDGKLGARSIIALGLGPQRSADTQFLVKPSSEAGEAP